MVALLVSGGSGSHPFAPFAGDAGDPLAYSSGRQADFERRAAAGLAPVLYEKSLGGVVATAQRVARFRPIVERVARAQRLDPDLLEALIFLESGGRPDAQASGDLHAAA
ncbi:MAG: lytic transglycosylase protein, partial [Solirubrobacteraceae bacterium]|nr:lytic transglycosylase protein [Solirubrobacteraceae bacterium]